MRRNVSGGATRRRQVGLEDQLEYFPMKIDYAVDSKGTCSERKKEPNLRRLVKGVAGLGGSQEAERG